MNTTPETKMGRPTVFTPELGDEICARIATSTKSLKRICEDEDLPEARTIYRWLRLYPDFCRQYAQAREEQQDLLVEETIDIADDSRNDYMEELDAKGDVKAVYFNKENVQRSRLRIDARHWQATKLKPKKYGLNPIGLQPLDKNGDPTDAFNPATMADTIMAAVTGAGINLDERDESGGE